jgi:uncharacterized protein YukE
VSEPSLVVRQGDLEALEAAMATAHDRLLAEVSGAREEVAALLTGWAPDTASRQAQLQFDADVQSGVERLAAALAQVRAALAEVRESARTTEVDNVALLD